MIENVLIVDTETSGLDPKKDHLIEFAYAKYSLTHGLTDCLSSVVKAPSNEAEHINKIPEALVRSDLVLEKQVVDDIFATSARVCDAVISHQIEFDRQWLPPTITPWICTMEDVRFATATKKGWSSVVTLALSYGVGVTSAHRAITDVLLLVSVFDRMRERGEDLPAALEHGLRPKALFVSLAPYEEKDVVKAHGFKWQPLPGQPPDSKPTHWWRRMAIEDTTALPFKTRQLAVQGSML